MLTLTELLESYKKDALANDESLREYKEAKKYYHGDQLDSSVLAILSERGQVPIIENIYKMIVNKILGYKIDNLTEIRVSGRQQEDRELANLIQDLLRAFSEQHGFEKELRKRDLDLLFGMGVFEVGVENNGDGVEIRLEHLPSDMVLVDRFSVDLSCADALRIHKRINLDLATARAKFPNCYIDHRALVDSRTTITESWVKEWTEATGKITWNRYFWHEVGGIYKYEISPYKNGMNPFIIQRLNIDHKNRWYGNFRDLKPLQDYINFAENRMANMMGSLKVFYEAGAVMDGDEFVAAASLDNAVVKVNDGALKDNRLQFVQHHADVAALSQKANEKRSLAKILSGLNEEALGMANNRQSGIAIAQRRNLGMMGLNHYISACDEMDSNLYKKAIDLIMYYFDAPQVFKIVDKKVGERYFAINQDPSNQIRVGKFDLVYKTTLKQLGREERFAHWTELLKTIAGVRADIVAPLLPLVLKDTDSPIIADIEEVIAKVDESAQANQEQQVALAQKQMDLQIAQAQAKIAETQAKAQKYEAQGELADTIAREAEKNGGKVDKRGTDLR